MRDINPVTIYWGQVEEADPIVMSELNRLETVSVCRRSPWRGTTYSRYPLIPPTKSSTCTSSAVARAMRVRRRGFMGVPGRDSPFSNFW